MCRRYGAGIFLLLLRNAIGIGRRIPMPLQKDISKLRTFRHTAGRLGIERHRNVNRYHLVTRLKASGSSPIPIHQHHSRDECTKALRIVYPTLKASLR